MWMQIEATVASLRRAPPSQVFDNATVFLRAMGHGVVGWLWLDQARVALPQAQAPFQAGKLRACRFFFECELPKIGPWLTVVASLSDVSAGATADLF